MIYFFYNKIFKGISFSYSWNVYVISEDAFFSWYNLTGNINLTWNSIETWISEPISEFDIFNSLNKKSLLYPVQPQQSYWDYIKNTNSLNTYAHNNMQTIEIPETTWWYLYIKLRKDLPPGRTAVIYINTAWRRCGGGIKQMWYTYNTNEYLYKLDNVPLIWSNCWDDRTSKISGKTVQIWWYVGTFDWNWIEEVSIARF